MSQAAFALRGRNPDVLTCIANLSNDEVFTPPDLVNQMLDELARTWADGHDGEDLWANSQVTFLDPCTKSGVFLREIVSRLSDGLQKEMPNLQSRIDHILTKQVFGIALTNLTGMLARRSVYCSKTATGKHSVTAAFGTVDGNIWFSQTEHSWAGGTSSILKTNGKGELVEVKQGGKCEKCGAAQSVYERDSSMESHAYAFIHDDAINLPEKLFGDGMKFDVIIGNPPYQLDDGGHSMSAAPIYNLFVEQAKALEPRLLSFVIPSRWFAGGKGLDNFRDSMLQDNRLRVIHDYPDSSTVFPGVQIKGGVCYFVWDRDRTGDCEVVSHKANGTVSTMTRPLLEPGFDIFIRFNEAISIVQKIVGESGLQVGDGEFAPAKSSFASIVSSRKPFGIDTKEMGGPNKEPSDVLIYRNGGTGYFPRGEVPKAKELIDTWKIFISYAYGAGESFPHFILGKPFIGAPGTISSETYVAIGPFESEEEAKNAVSYIQTRLFRFLVLLRKPTQHATRGVYSLVPMLDFNQSWTDEKLNEMFALTEQEIEFIDQMIRPMDGSVE